mgnify:CR=1 FL=1
MEPAPASLRQVMDYCSRKKYQLPLIQRIELALQITDAVSYLHSLTPPLIHGNLHPDNVLLTSSFTPKLTDVGITLKRVFFIASTILSSLMETQHQQMFLLKLATFSV